MSAPDFREQAGDEYGAWMGRLTSPAKIAALETAEAEEAFITLRAAELEAEYEAARMESQEPA